MIAALALTAVLVLLAAFQVALVFGAPWGHFAWGGRERVLSTRLRRASAFSLLIYLGIAVVELNRAGLLDVIPSPLAEVCAWVVFAYFCIGVVMNAISRSKPERFTMTPVALVLAVLSLLVALS